MKLEITADKFGTYSKGDIIDIPASTAEALIVHKVAKEAKGKVAEAKVQEDKTEIVHTVEVNADKVAKAK